MARLLESESLTGWVKQTRITSRNDASNPSQEEIDMVRLAERNSS
jgi:hypothetical protein